MANAKSNESERARMAEVGEVQKAIRELSREDRKLGEQLLDAAVAGAVVARQPADAALRAEAAAAWAKIAPLLEHHLASEEKTVLPWAERSGDLPHKLIRRAQERAVRLHELARLVAGTAFAKAADAEVAKAGRALCAVAVHLDDLIDSEEREMFPQLNKRLSAAGTGRAHR